YNTIMRNNAVLKLYKMGKDTNFSFNTHTHTHTLSVPHPPQPDTHSHTRTPKQTKVAPCHQSVMSVCHVSTFRQLRRRPSEGSGSRAGGTDLCCGLGKLAYFFWKELRAHTCTHDEQAMTAARPENTLTETHTHTRLQHTHT